MARGRGRWLPFRWPPSLSRLVLWRSIASIGSSCAPSVHPWLSLRLPLFSLNDSRRTDVTFLRNLLFLALFLLLLFIFLFIIMRLFLLLLLFLFLLLFLHTFKRDHVPPSLNWRHGATIVTEPVVLGYVVHGRPKTVSVVAVIAPVAQEHVLVSSLTTADPASNIHEGLAPGHGSL